MRELFSDVCRDDGTGLDVGQFRESLKAIFHRNRRHEFTNVAGHDGSGAWIGVSLNFRPAVRSFDSSEAFRGSENFSWSGSFSWAQKRRFGGVGASR